jgi:hypothetical protein
MGAKRSPAAVRLLTRVIATGEFTTEALAAELVIPVEMVDRFASNDVPMPLERQLALALFVIERVPSLARSGHQLKGQVAAALAFATKVTEVHSGAPPVRQR